MSTGRDQRRAVGAAELALRLLAAGDGPGARRAAEAAARLDRVGVFADLPAAVEEAAAGSRAGAVRPATRSRLTAAVGEGPLRALAEGLVASGTDGPEDPSDGTKVPM